MTPAPSPHNEAERLQRLRDAAILDTEADDRFDRLTGLAARFCGVPIALVSLVDEHRQWFKSRVGLNACETGRDEAFCAHAILRDETLVVEDALLDPRFVDNPLVTGPPHVRFYAGAPLRTADGLALGTLCLIDHEPRYLTEDRLALLESLAAQASALIESDLRIRALEAAQRETMQLAARLDDTAAHLPGFIYQYRLAPDGTSSFPYASDGIRGVYQVTPEEAAESAAPIINRIHEADQQRVMQEIIESAELGTAWTSEYRYWHEDGSYRWLAGHSTPRLEPDGATVWHGFISDITATKEIELRLRLTMDAARLGAWDWHIAEDRVRFSDRWLAMLGYAPGELPMTPQTLIDLLHPDDAADVAARLAAHFEGVEPDYQSRRRMRTKAGSWRWVESIGRVIERDREGRPVRMLGVQQDVHASHVAQAALEEARDEAEAANRAKSAFLANISHEIRTPLNAILGYAEVLRDAPDGVATDEAVETIHQAGAHLLGLVSDVLDLSKIEAERVTVEPRVVDLPALVRDAAGLVRPLAEARGLTLTLAADGRIPAGVRLDPLRTRQVLMNVLGNAVKFTDMGTVAMRVGFEPGDAGDGGELWMEVTDTGCGMTPEQASMLFEPFVQADSSATRAFGGTGLGLTISRRLARLMGGELALVETRRRAGSRFRLSLPVQASASAGFVESLSEGSSTAGARSASDGSGPAVASISGRILLVDDGLDNRRLFGFLLSKAGADVTLAEDGVAGVEAYRAAMDAGEPFGLVVTDVQMPRMDGHAVARMIREQDAATPIVAITAHASSEDRAAAMAAGCDDYAAKPIDRARLLALCGRWLSADARRGAA